ncbi:hypothetical protein PSTT_02924 [Puccinia striiformis]|uniref:Uncharacterized protein n=1 Tax=Puccinia striiformis TaxID=27350 RepID=A0A2S4VYE6_9BASI|nr:hypothetical protein PSTT_02924 [Puccinia striiformis]
MPRMCTLKVKKLKYKHTRTYLRDFLHRDESGNVCPQAACCWATTKAKTHQLFKITNVKSYNQFLIKAKKFGLKDSINTEFLNQAKTNRAIRLIIKDLADFSPNRLFNPFLQLKGSKSLGYSSAASHPLEASAFPFKTPAFLGEEDKTSIPVGLRDGNESANIGQIPQLQMNKHDKLQKGVFVAVAKSARGPFGLGMIDSLWEIKQPAHTPCYYCNIVIYHVGGVDEEYGMRQLERTSRHAVMSTRVSANMQQQVDPLEAEDRRLPSAAYLFGRLFSVSSRGIFARVFTFGNHNPSLCPLKKTKALRMEHQQTAAKTWQVEHTDTRHFLINSASLHDVDLHRTISDVSVPILTADDWLDAMTRGLEVWNDFGDNWSSDGLVTSGDEVYGGDVMGRLAAVDLSASTARRIPSESQGQTIPIPGEQGDNAPGEAAVGTGAGPVEDGLHSDDAEGSTDNGLHSEDADGSTDRGSLPSESSAIDSSEAEDSDGGSD